MENTNKSYNTTFRIDLGLFEKELLGKNKNNTIGFARGFC